VHVAVVHADNAPFVVYARDARTHIVCVASARERAINVFTRGIAITVVQRQGALIDVSANRPIAGVTKVARTAVQTNRIGACSVSSARVGVQDTLVFVRALCATTRITSIACTQKRAIVVSTIGVNVAAVR